MPTAFPIWDYHVLDHRGNWVQRVDEGLDYLSEYACMGAYQKELAGEYLSEAESQFLDKAYPLVRHGRTDGYLDREAHSAVENTAFEAAARACRIEGIPVVQDYPVSMHSAIKSYGCLLAQLYRNSAPTYPWENTGEPSENDWAASLTHVFKIQAGWTTHIEGDPSRGIEFITRSCGISDDKQREFEKSARIVESFNGVAHQFPDLLQAVITLSDHLKLSLPTISPVSQLTVKLWQEFDVASAQFVKAIRVQPRLMGAMSGDQFETFVARVFRDVGFEVMKTKRSHDGGYDLRLVRPLLPNLRISFLVQCKNPVAGGPVGVSVIRAFRGISDDLRAKTSGGIVATSTRFTGAARKEALASAWEIVLVERGDLLQLLDLAQGIAK